MPSSWLVPNPVVCVAAGAADGSLKVWDRRKLLASGS
jgi:hypothetical protein